MRAHLISPITRTLGLRAPCALTLLGGFQRSSQHALISYWVLPEAGLWAVT